MTSSRLQFPLACPNFNLFILKNDQHKLEVIEKKTNNLSYVHKSFKKIFSDNLRWPFTNVSFVH